MRKIRNKILASVFAVAMMVGSTFSASATEWVAVFTIELPNSGVTIIVEECQRAFLSVDGCTLGDQQLVVIYSLNPE